jgi:hypothetical protein
MACELDRAKIPARSEPDLRDRSLFSAKEQFLGFARRFERSPRPAAISGACLLSARHRERQLSSGASEAIVCFTEDILMSR